ncbi:hypothetical protein [Dyadobacter sp. CY312]|uniref:hypothetical protein n=1 Tax=Dyadobacter sp. CY312 TaxID=2907303 RepID=UPI001F3ECE98|nr:hypothetical protein [Dyadobacter sp. CY312]MCE7039241.1 hypothetical protein [Dyadobacter sp. CY312]
MSGLVTVTVGSEFPLRVMEAGSQNSVEFGSFVYPGKDGALEMKHFQDEMAQVAPLSINGLITFDKSNPIDQHNFAMLNLFLTQNPDWKKDISISDPEVEIEEELQLSAISFEVETFIRKNEKNIPLLAKLYRRIIGPVNGITEKYVFNTLTILAKTDPLKFKTKGDYVYEDRSFEVLSLIDSCVERGLMSIDLDGTVKRKDGKIYAENIDKAAFYLEGDHAERTTLERLVYDKDPQPMKYVPSIETSNLAEFKTQTGSVAAQKFDGSIDPDVLLAEIKTNIPKLVDEGFFERTGQGATTRYNFPGIPTPQFTKTELAEHFVKNPKQYEDFKERANL